MIEVSLKTKYIEFRLEFDTIEEVLNFMRNYMEAEHQFIYFNIELETHNDN